MQRFIQSHPEWKDTPPLGKSFEWKWYFAFHQLGDETVAADMQAYRDSIEKRQAYAEGVGLFLPSVGAQLMLERLADTDIERYLGYQGHITDFHTALRHFYYSYIFNKVGFHEPEFAKAPRFEAKPYSGGAGITGLLALLGLTAGIWWVGLWQIRKSLG